MALQSSIFAGNAFLDRVAQGGALLFWGSMANDATAVQLLQQALVLLGFPMPVTFRSGGPDGHFGQETHNAVIGFQKVAFSAQPMEWDGRVGKRTLGLLDAEVLRRKPGPAPVPPPAPVSNFVCGPDVTAEVQAVWSRIETEFKVRPRGDKIKLCNKILMPVNDPAGLVKELMDSLKSGQVPNLQQIMAKVREHADIDGWDVLPLYQGASQWLRTPPVFDPKTNGPFATPSSSDFANADQFAAGHEDEATCSNTVQVAGKCWLNGSVNYGTYGIMVKSCSEFAASDLFLPKLSNNPFDQPLKLNPIIRAMYSLTWATTLIKAYKKFGNNPEGAVIPVAWTEATFNGGPRGAPSIPGNRPKCQCMPGLTGSIVNWDYVWEPLKMRTTANGP